MAIEDPLRRDAAADGRDESATERSDRNWAELLQELRVTQMGVQILTGFLLTVPFQERFTELDGFQRRTYLVLVLLAVTATGLLTAPVSLYRMLFRKRLKTTLVTSADVLARSGLAVLSLVVTGTALLIFDFVVGRTAGLAVAGVVLAVLALLWLALPMHLLRMRPGEERHSVEGKRRTVESKEGP